MKTYLYGDNLAADIFLYRYGNALKSTFPLAQQSLETESNIKGYSNSFHLRRIIAENYNYNQWLNNYNYEK